VQKGVLHKNTASRYKSRLHARVKALTQKASQQVLPLKSFTSS
jgi:small subunit ribosomal protein S20